MPSKRKLRKKAERRSKRLIAALRGKESDRPLVGRLEAYRGDQECMPITLGHRFQIAMPMTHYTIDFWKEKWATDLILYADERRMRVYVRETFNHGQV